MLHITGHNVWVENCVFEQSNGAGISFQGLMDANRSLGERMNITLYNCEIKDNGQIGFNGINIYGLLMENCLISGNNVKGFNIDWEGGGGKFMYCRDALFDRCVVSRNNGPGIWIDFGNEEVEVKNCLLIENGTTGVYYEASYTLHAHDNVLFFNNAVGIGLSTSMGCLIERNLFVGNRSVGFMNGNGTRGVYRIDTPETSPDKNPSHWFPSGQAYWIWSAENTVRNNIFAYNVAQVSGWQDVTEAPYQWPSHLDAPMQAFIAEQGDAMQLHHENNFFVQTSASTPLFSGIFSEQNRTFYTLETLRQVRPDVEAGSRTGQIAFADRNALDLRIPANSEAVQMGCYPQGEVPGVKLGLTGTNDVKTVPTGQYRIYPTLVKDNLTITGAENGTIFIVNTSGVVLYSTNRAKITESVSMGNYPKGVYFVRVNGNVTKIIKK
jgi:hypothetical protein